MKMLAQVGAIAALLSVLTLAMLLPFLPGRYDGLAFALSTVVQMVGITGLLLVPVGLFWLIHEVRRARRLRNELPARDWSVLFAIVALVVASLVVLTFYVVATGFDRNSLGWLLVGVWLYAVLRLGVRLRSMRGRDQQERVPSTFNPAPIYLLIVPPAILALQLVLAQPVTAWSRDRAIASSAELIAEIESYASNHGEYPPTLQAMHRDFNTNVIGIDRFEYSRRLASYNIAFEQPRFFLDQFGAREWVVYNPQDEHVILSHTVWNMLWAPDELPEWQGWFVDFDLPQPHWRYFWFD